MISLHNHTSPVGRLGQQAGAPVYNHFLPPRGKLEILGLIDDYNGGFTSDIVNVMPSSRVKYDLKRNGFTNTSSGTQGFKKFVSPNNTSVDILGDGIEFKGFISADAAIARLSDLKNNTTFLTAVAEAQDTTVASITAYLDTMTNNPASLKVAGFPLELLFDTPTTPDANLLNFGQHWHIQGEEFEDPATAGITYDTTYQCIPDKNSGILSVVFDGLHMEPGTYTISGNVTYTERQDNTADELIALSIGNAELDSVLLATNGYFNESFAVETTEPLKFCLMGWYAGDQIEVSNLSLVRDDDPDEVCYIRANSDIVTNTQTVVAVYGRTSYEYTFYDSDNSVYATQFVTYGESPTDPTLESGSDTITFPSEVCEVDEFDITTPLIFEFDGWGEDSRCSPSLWTQGGIDDNTGASIASNTTIRTDFIEGDKYSKVDIAEGYYVTLYIYDENKQLESKQAGFTFTLQLPSSVVRKYVRFVAGLVNGEQSQVDVSEYYNFVFTYATPEKISLDDYHAGKEDVYEFSPCRVTTPPIFFRIGGGVEPIDSAYANSQNTDLVNADDFAGDEHKAFKITVSELFTTDEYLEIYTDEEAYYDEQYCLVDFALAEDVGYNTSTGTQARFIYEQLNIQGFCNIFETWLVGDTVTIVDVNDVLSDTRADYFHVTASSDIDDTTEGSVKIKSVTHYKGLKRVDHGTYEADEPIVRAGVRHKTFEIIVDSPCGSNDRLDVETHTVDFSTYTGNNTAADNAEFISDSLILSGLFTQSSLQVVGNTVRIVNISDNANDDSDYISTRFYSVASGYPDGEIICQNSSRFVVDSSAEIMQQFKGWYEDAWYEEPFDGIVSKTKPLVLYALTADIIKLTFEPTEYHNTDARLTATPRVWYVNDGDYIAAGNKNLLDLTLSHHITLRSAVDTGVDAESLVNSITDPLGSEMQTYTFTGGHYNGWGKEVRWSVDFDDLILTPGTYTFSAYMIFTEKSSVNAENRENIWFTSPGTILGGWLVANKEFNNSTGAMLKEDAYEGWFVARITIPEYTYVQLTETPPDWESSYVQYYDQQKTRLSYLPSAPTNSISNYYRRVDQQGGIPFYFGLQRQSTNPGTAFYAKYLQLERNAVPTAYVKPARTQFTDTTPYAEPTSVSGQSARATSIKVLRGCHLTAFDEMTVTTDREYVDTALDGSELSWSTDKYPNGRLASEYVEPMVANTTFTFIPGTVIEKPKVTIDTDDISVLLAYYEQDDNGRFIKLGSEFVIDTTPGSTGSEPHYEIRKLSATEKSECPNNVNDTPRYLVDPVEQTVMLLTVDASTMIADEPYHNETYEIDLSRFVPYYANFSNGESNVFDSYSPSPVVNASVGTTNTVSVVWKTTPTAAIHLDASPYHGLTFTVDDDNADNHYDIDFDNDNQTTIYAISSDALVNQGVKTDVEFADISPVTLKNRNLLDFSRPYHLVLMDKLLSDTTLPSSRTLNYPDDDYTLMRTSPSDWTSGWSNYYKYVGNQYVQLSQDDLTASSPVNPETGEQYLAFARDTYYQKHNITLPFDYDTQTYTYNGGVMDPSVLGGEARWYMEFEDLTLTPGTYTFSAYITFISKATTLPSAFEAMWYCLPGGNTGNSRLHPTKTSDVELKQDSDEGWVRVQFTIDDNEPLVLGLQRTAQPTPGTHFTATQMQIEKAETPTDYIRPVVDMEVADYLDADTGEYFNDNELSLSTTDEIDIKALVQPAYYNNRRYIDIAPTSYFATDYKLTNSGMTSDTWLMIEAEFRDSVADHNIFSAGYNDKWYVNSSGQAAYAYIPNSVYGDQDPSNDTGVQESELGGVTPDTLNSFDVSVSDFATDSVPDYISVNPVMPSSSAANNPSFWIDYQIQPNSIIEIDMEFAAFDLNKWDYGMRVFSSKSNNALEATRSIFVTSGGYIGYSHSDGSDSDFVAISELVRADTNRHTFVYNEITDKLIIDNNEYSMSGTCDNPCKASGFTIFGDDAVNGTNILQARANAKLYRVRIYEDAMDSEHLVREYIPTYNPETDEVGLEYNGQLVTSAGSVKASLVFSDTAITVPSVNTVDGEELTNAKKGGLSDYVSLFKNDINNLPQGDTRVYGAKMFVGTAPAHDYKPVFNSIRESDGRYYYGLYDIVTGTFKKETSLT